MENETDNTTNDEQSIVREKRRKKIVESIKQNDRTLNPLIVFDIIDYEFKRRENEGQKLTDQYLKGKIDRESCLLKLQDLGYNSWWGSDSLWYIMKIEEFSVAAHPLDLSILEAVCIMEYVSSHVITGQDRLKRKRARVILHYDIELNVSSFTFAWVL